MPARIKTKQKTTKKRLQASRGLNSPPPKLAELIEIVNLVPPDASLAGLYEMWKEIKELAKEDDDIAKQYYGDFEFATTFVTFWARDFPENFRNYIWPKDAKEKSEAIGLEKYIDLAISKYTFVHNCREDLRAIIQLVDSTTAAPFLLPQLGPAILTLTYIYLDKDGLIQFEGDVFTQAVEGVEASRIRECAICKRIYWAGRITQQCCSTACAHALRNRRYRARYKDYLIRRHLKESQAAEQDSKNSSPKIGKRDSKKGKKV